MNTHPAPTITRVVIHSSSSGRYAVGVLVGQFRGTNRVDRRIYGALPLDRVQDAPPGVDRWVWLAFLGLQAHIDQARRDRMAPEQPEP